MSHTLFKLLDELDAAHIHYALARFQPDSVMVTITLGSASRQQCSVTGTLRWRVSLGQRRLRVARTCCNSSFATTEPKPKLYSVRLNWRPAKQPVASGGLGSSGVGKDQHQQWE
jgi:hypothetical protein